MNTIFDDWGAIKNPPITTATGSPPVIIAEQIEAAGVTEPISLALGQEYNVYGYGDFDGATVDVEWSIDSTGDLWQLATSGVTTFLQGGIEASGLFVMVGVVGTILTSPDTIIWTTQTGAGTDFLRNITFGLSGYVIVGSLGVIYSSPDAVTWTLRTSGTSSTLRDVIFQNSLYVVVGAAGTILTSPDAVTWTPRTSPNSSLLRAITFGAGLFVAVGGGGNIITSPDGISWTERASPIGATLSAIIYTGEIFVAISDSTSLPNIMRSPDGISWTVSQGIEGESLAALDFEVDTYLVGGAGGKLFTSKNLVAWEEQDSRTNQDIWILFNGQGINVFGANTGTIGTSITTWTPLTDVDSAAVQFTVQGVFNIPRIGSEVLLRTNTTNGGTDLDVTIDLR